MSRCPADFELGLFNSVLDPMVAHVDGFAPLDFGRFVSHVTSRCIVIGDDSRFLWVAKVAEGLSVGGGIKSIKVHGCIRGLHGGVYNCRNDGC